MSFMKKLKCCEKMNDDEADAFAAVTVILVLVAGVGYWLSSMPW